jgi:hypothetical protein
VNGAGETTGGDCGYCAGLRCNCTCEKDCGARPAGLPSVPWCPRAEGYIGWLRATGLYGEDELARLAERGHR